MESHVVLMRQRKNSTKLHEGGGEWVCSVDNGFGASTTVQVYLSVLG